MKGKIITIASIKDAQEIYDLQNLAYISEAEIIDDFTISPLHQTLNEILSEFRNRIFLKLERGDRILGSVRACIENGTCLIGK